MIQRRTGSPSRNVILWKHKISKYLCSIHLQKSRDQTVNLNLLRHPPFLHFLRLFEAS